MGELLSVRISYLMDIMDICEPAVYLSGSAYPKWGVPLMHKLLRITLLGANQIPGALTN